MLDLPVLATVFVGLALAAPATELSPPGAGVAAKPSATADARQPLLSIAVDNGQTAVAAGDKVTYKIRVHNLGTTDTRQLRISQSLPAGLTFISADHDGAAQAGSVTWLVNLKAGQELTRTTVAEIGETPGDLLRLATVACATVKGGKKPLVCATHSALLPAGAVAARVDQPASHRIWYAVAATALVVVAGLAAIVINRRRRRRLRHRAVPARREAGESIASVLTAD